MVTRRFVRSLDDRGAAAVEFALVLPVLLIILFGIVQFGMLFSVHNTMVNAAREAARGMAVEEMTATEGEALATNRLQAWGNLGFDVQATEPDPSDPTDQDVTVTVSVPVSEAMLVDVLGLAGNRNLEARMVMRRESL